MSWLAPALTLAAMLAASAPAVAAEGDVGLPSATVASPVVVELYTSQGCNTCPPADVYLAELARRPEIVALSLHVDYWDYIGWKDPFGSAENTARQRAYSKAFGLHMVYTPQMVIDGTRQAVGSARAEVERAIAAAARSPKLPLRFVLDASGRIRVVLPEHPLEAPATVWLVVYDDRHETPVRRGENAGRTLKDANVVREMRKVGEWDGRATELPLMPAAEYGDGGCAVILQAGPTGPILGAAALDLPVGS